MKLKVVSLFLSLSLFVSTYSHAAEFKTKTVNGKSVQYKAQEVLVCYKPNRINRTRRFLSSQLNSSVIRSLPDIRVDLVKVPEGWTEENFIKELQKHPDVEFAELNTQFKSRFSPNDLLSPYPQGPTFVNLELAWDITRGNSSIVVAVIDTGVDLEHPDLNANRWINTDEVASNGLDDDGNGYVDDVNGFDFVNRDGDPDDNNGSPLNGLDIFHGTHASGIIAAVANNGSDIAGVAHNAQIMALKCLNFAGGGDAAEVSEAILYAVNNGAHILNLSLGSDLPNAVVSSAVNVAIANNRVVVAAAGNTDPAETSCAVEYPAGDEGVIAVSSVNQSNELATSSCSGTQVEIAAPGDDIVSTTGSGIGAASGTRTLTGTSFAAPMVAGVAALLLSLDSNMSAQDVRRYLLFHADDLGPAGFDTSFGFGRLDAFQTLQAANNNETFVSNPGFPGETFSYPNPYDPTTGKRVTISLPQGLGSAGLQIRIFNSSGVRVKTLTGTNEWDGKNDDGNAVSAGLYFYYAQTNSGDTKGKMTVLK